MNRRHWLLAGTGVAAAAAGVAWQLGRPTGPGAAAEPAAASAADGTTALWGMSFDKPDGGALAMASLRGQPLLLNFWGTWCPPCIKEMPELDRFARQFAPAGWRVLGLAVDNPKAVREYLARSPVSYLIALAGFEGSALTTALGNTQSGLPYTIALNARGVISHRKAGATTFDELAGWAKAG